MPTRYQRRFSKRKDDPPIPVGAIYVGRPTHWGNPFKITSAIENGFAADKDAAQILVVECFRDWLYSGNLSSWWFHNGAEQHTWIREHIRDLYEKDLVCWCRPDQVCHADVLMKAAAEYQGLWG